MDTGNAHTVSKEEARIIISKEKSIRQLKFEKKKNANEN